MAYVFVYGTLRLGESNHHLLLESRMVAMSARTVGRLVDTGYGYPGLIQETEGLVNGEVYEIDSETLFLLDQLEEYFGPGDSRNHYERVNIPVETEDGSLSAWSYVYLENNRNHIQKTIEEGDWKLYSRLTENSTNI